MNKQKQIGKDSNNNYKIRFVNLGEDQQIHRFQFKDALIRNN